MIQNVMKVKKIKLFLMQSNYMMNDKIALNGFHKMFKKYWNAQVDNMHNIMKYQIKRGELPTLRATNVI